MSASVSGKKTVLSDVSFEAHPGEQIAIVGRNGCGKTTLLKILTGIEPANDGWISFFGEKTGAHPKELSKICGYVPQENPLLEELSVKDNLRLWGGAKSLSDQKLQHTFDLKEIMNTRISKLSGGMKRRVAIACAVSRKPAVVVMDEPTAAVDVYYKSMIRQWMQDFTRENGILILATHDMQEIADSSRCLLLKDGRMRELERTEVSLEEIYRKIKE